MLLTQIHLHRHTTTILHANMTVGRVMMATNVIREFPLRRVRIIKLYWHFGIMRLLCHANLTYDYVYASLISEQPMEIKHGIY